VSKNKNHKNHGSTGNQPSAPKSAGTKKGKKSLLSKFPILPIPFIVFLLIWIWASWWQGDVFRMVRENSFFAPSELLMQYKLSQSYGLLWTAGRALLMLFRYPWLGGAVLAFMLTLCCWLLGYAMRLTPRWRWIQWMPLCIYTGIFTYEGMNNYFEAETGQEMGIPLAILAILTVWGIIIRSFSRKPSPAFLRIPKDETHKDNLLQLAVVTGIGFVPALIYGNIERSYVRPIASMQVDVLEQDWNEVIHTAEANAEKSYRPFAAQYAIALVQTGQIADKLFNIRLDYDSVYCVGMNGNPNNVLNTYQMECDFHAGLVETAYHHAMENMAMEGPTLRNLKMLCKTSLLRSEWELADKYLTVLDQVPFEGDFVEKYRPMLFHEDAVNADPEFAVVRLSEPLHDNFENLLVQPVFLGYNASLREGRSNNALLNSLMVNIYTKATQEFLMRCQAIVGQTPPTSISQALTLLSGKYPEIIKSFKGLEYYRGELESFLSDVQPFIQARPGITKEEKEELAKLGVTPSGSDTLTSAENRALNARRLFPKYKGFYPYYYFFGNLKATKKKDTKESSNAGVN